MISFSHALRVRTPAQKFSYAQSRRNAGVAPRPLLGVVSTKSHHKSRKELYQLCLFQVDFGIKKIV